VKTSLSIDHTGTYSVDYFNCMRLLYNLHQHRIGPKFRLTARRLVQLDDKAPLPAAIETLLARSPEPARLAGFFQVQGFRSLLSRLGLGDAKASIPAMVAAPAMVPAAEGDIAFGPYETITTEAGLRGFLAGMDGILGFDTETDSLDALNARLVGIALATAPGRAAYLPLRHGGGDMLSGPPPEQLSQDAALAILRPTASRHDGRRDGRRDGWRRNADSHRDSHRQADYRRGSDNSHRHRHNSGAHSPARRRQTAPARRQRQR
jgi:hypothetical protein